MLGSGTSSENVFFELGFAQAMKKRMLVLGPGDAPLSTWVSTGIPYVRAELTNPRAVDFECRGHADADTRFATRWVLMSRISAGLLMYRIRSGRAQVLLVHPGGPFFRKKDQGAWSIPKGEVEPEEDMLEAARREFEEETGCRPSGPFAALTSVKQSGGKTVHAWAFEGDCDLTTIVSNTFTMEWPPRSGRQAEFFEIDRCEFFAIADARLKINPAQVNLIDELEEMLGRRV
jgi:predicted NUDIX family NTP pyrophosphohydrolase